MILRRTTNAGMLIKTKDLSVLLDGVARELPPYEGTPSSIKEELLLLPPDYVLYTHNHKDHYDADYASKYSSSTGSKVYVAEDNIHLVKGETEIFSVKTRHIGRTDVNHVSYIINGSKCIWFMGDASPLELNEYPKPDILIVPYAYTVTESSWKTALGSGADKIILLHLPQRDNDEYGLWTMTEAVTKSDSRLLIPEIGQTIETNKI